MSLQLHVIAGPDVGRVFSLQAGTEQIFGRGPNAGYRVTDPCVSRSHCQIIFDGDQVVVADAGSSAGIFVNGKKVDRQPLKIGDILQVGDTRLRLQNTEGSRDSTVNDPVMNPAPDTITGMTSSNADRLAALTGQTLSHFEVGPVLGKGASCMVFLARDLDDGRQVALKILLPEFTHNDEEMQRFVRAMKTMLPLRHPNLIILYAAGKTGSYCWMSMEYVEGEVLKKTIERNGSAGVIDWQQAFRVAVHIGRGLAYAHAQQIVHRNISPSNIIVRKEDQTAKLGDLMLAKALEGGQAQHITRAGELVGDVTYMSPERTRGMTDVDGRSDIYSLGATVYILLTGRPPFPGSNLIERISKIREAEPVKPTQLQPAIPEWFEAKVLKMLAKNPRDRYQNAADMVRELEQAGKIEGLTV